MIEPVTSEPVMAGVTLRGDELPWRGVSQRLRTVRWLILTAVAVPVLLAFATLAVLVSAWFWAAAVVALAVACWLLWLVARQVSAMSWIELDQELVIRRGRLFRTLVSVPYGRMQYVDLTSGPLARRFGLASLQIHTSSPESGGVLDGLPTVEAEQLRARLMARGESQRAGL